MIKTLALGRFDGMHIGHRRLFEEIKDGGILVIEHQSNLTPQKERCRYTSHPCFFYPLSTIKHLDKEAFVSLLKKDFPALEKIIVGFDFRFGKNRQGDGEYLREFFDTTIIEEVQIDGEGVHSGAVRELLKSGNIAKATNFLGRPYSIKGVQIKGQGIGKKELFATVNIDAKPFLLPKEGVYATKTNGHPSVSFIGTRSTDGSFAVESHFLETFGESTHYRIEFLEFLRENRKFDDLNMLKQQIQEDIERAKRVFMI